MPLVSLTSDEIQKIMTLGESPLLQEILDLKKEIEAQTRVGEVRYALTREVDQTLVQEIVAMKRKIDYLYIKLLQGEDLSKP